MYIHTHNAYVHEKLYIMNMHTYINKIFQVETT